MFSPMVDLPTQLLIEILSRLPIESIFVCRCVCKLWFDLLSNTCFTNFYPSKTLTTLLLQPTKNNLNPFIDYNFRTSHLFHLQPNTSYSTNSVLTFKLGTNYPNLVLSLANSCKGLLCLYDHEINDHVYVCNPMSREFIALPKSGLGFQPCVFYHFGFGFGPMCKQYKVIRIVESRSFAHKKPRGKTSRQSTTISCTAEIYTFGEGAWRSLGDAPKFMHRDSYNTLLNGIFHWETVSHDPYISFNFDTEQFGTIDGPPPIDEYGKGPTSLGVLRNCLSVCNYKNLAQLEIWVMKEYGVRDSWTKEYVIEWPMDFILESGEILMVYYYCDLIMILESGEILMLFEKQHLVACDPELQCFRLFKPSSVAGERFEAFSYVPTLVSLKDVAVGENIEVCAG